MARRNSDRIDGIAIDGNGTVAHHQIFSLNKKDRILHYTLFSEPYYKNETFYTVPDNFIDDMAQETPLDKAERTRMIQSFAAFANTIRVHGSQTAFDLFEDAKALTIDIHYDKNFNMFGMGYRATLGRMVDKMTYGDAIKNMHKNEDLRILNAIGQAACAHNTKTVLSFEEVTSLIGQHIGKEKFNSDMFDNLDTIYRSDNNSHLTNKNYMKKIGKHAGMDLREWAEKANPYQSVLHYGTHLYHQVPEPKNPTVKITSGKDIISHFNHLQTRSFLLNGYAMFDNDVTRAVINYQKHVLAWKCQDMQMP